MARRKPERPADSLDIRDVQTIKHDRVFFLCDRHGDVPEPNTAALGLYFRDTRFLSRWELVVNGVRPLHLHSEADRNYSMVVEGTLPITRVSPNGMETRENIVVSRQRWLEGGMREVVRVQNFGMRRLRVRLDFRFAADFLDLFEVRGMPRERASRVLEPAIDASSVRLACEGVDDVLRSLEIRFDPPPRRLRRGHASYEVALEPGARAEITAALLLAAGEHSPPADGYEALERRYSAWRRSCTRFRVANANFQGYLNRAIVDLRMMQTDAGGTPAIDAGVPWFSTLFGRDALVTAYQALGVAPELAKGTLRTLAAHQGTAVDHARDEEPGKILHELRCGELAGAGLIPHTPYYGSIDATPLWLVVYGCVWSWTADRALAEELWPAAERALEWIDRYGDHDGDGYVEYVRRSEGGLDNQGWKDSRDGIVHADGSLPDPPIALCEVQGYVYDAKRRVAAVARALGRDETAERLEAEAAGLRERFNRDFWMPAEGTYAVALDGSKRAVRSVASNAGHCLWSGIAEEDKAPRVARRLLSGDMSSGWGIRTLSSRTPGFDPVGYHTGSVWPHDNSLIAHGFKRYGLDDACTRVIDQLAAAGACFRDARFPELFCGFGRDDVPLPVEYPVACRPQAWATGAVLLMMRSYGGLTADAPARTLTIVRPTLPRWLERAEIIGMRVGEARLDLLYTSHGGATGVQVLRKHGDLDVVVRY